MVCLVPDCCHATRIKNRIREQRQETADAIALGYVNESVKRAGEYAADISDNVINYLVEEDRLPKRKKSKTQVLESSRKKRDDESAVILKQIPHHFRDLRRP
jgi:hypothetical protein